MSEKFFERKIKTLFKRFDFDNDGSIDETDFVKWANNLINYGVLTDSQKKKLNENLKQLWSEYFCAVDKSGNKDGKVSCSELIEYIKESLKDEQKKKSLENTIPLIFEAIDTDHDDAVSKVEFANYFKSLNINDQKTADEVFASMDIDKDGSLSKTEFTAFGKAFFTSKNENDPSKHFFGHLVD